MNLVLHLKKEYFDQIASGEKVEEYRLVTGYWSRRLEGRSYDNVVLLCGYPARDDPRAVKIVRPWKGYTRKSITHPHFGAHPVEVFAINVAPNNASTRTGGSVPTNKPDSQPEQSTAKSADTNPAARR